MAGASKDSGASSPAEAGSDGCGVSHQQQQQQQQQQRQMLSEAEIVRLLFLTGHVAMHQLVCGYGFVRVYVCACGLGWGGVGDMDGVGGVGRGVGVLMYWVYGCTFCLSL